MSQQDVQTSSGGSTGKIVAIGCGIVLLVAVFAVFVIYFSVKNAVLGYVEDFTSTEAAQLAKPMGSEEDAQVVIARFDEFIAALEDGKETEPLSLSENEINQLIYYHPRWRPLSDEVRVTMEGDEIGGQVSIPLDDLADLLEALEGRYLNGSATFTIGLTGGRLLIFLESLEVNGKSMPEPLMSSLNAENLAEKSNADPKVQKQLESLQSIAVENGELTIVPKPVAERPAADPVP